MRRHTSIFVTLAITVVTQSHMGQCLGQTGRESESKNKAADDKYRFDKTNYLGDHFKAFEAASALLRVAIADGAPELDIAKLRVDTSTTAFQCRRDGVKDWDLILQTIEHVIRDPSPLLVNYESAKYFVDGVAVYLAALSNTEQGEQQIRSAIQRAMDELESAMALSERERFVLTARLRQSGCVWAKGRGNLKEAVDWLTPVLENRNWMTQDAYGVELLNTISILHAHLSVELGKNDDGLAGVRNQVGEIKASSMLSDARKMELIDSLLLSYLVRFRDDPMSLGAAVAWQEVLDHLAEMESYDGDDSQAICHSILVSRRVMLEYFPSRDYAESIRIADQMMQQILLNPELFKDQSEALATFSSWCKVLVLLIEADDPRHSAFRDQLTAFISEIKTGDFHPMTIALMESELRRIK